MHKNLKANSERSKASDSGRNTQKRRPIIRVAAVAAAALTALSLASTTASASANPAKVGRSAVMLRDRYHPQKQAQPSQSCSGIVSIAPGTPVTLVCQHEGQNISGDVWWDYVRTPNNGYGYMSDLYVDTGSAYYRVPGVDYCNY